MVKAAGNNAQPSSSKPKKIKSSVGAPSQLKQSSRKGKKAWRKNVDLEDLDDSLEGMRAEERTFGLPIHQREDKDLFEIDVQPADEVRTTLPKFSFSQLTSAKLLAERSAVPAVFSRPITSKRKNAVNREDKDRLLRISKRPRKGPFNSVMDPTEQGAGSAMVGVSEAAKQSGTYDPWAPVELEEVAVKEGMETVYVKPIKPPQHRHPKTAIDVPAVTEPHLGTSYNPPVEAHQELLLQAHAMEEKRVAELDKMAETKKKMEGVVAVTDSEGPTGMEVGPGEATSDVEGEAQDLLAIAKKKPERKSKQQRKKTARAIAEKRALAERMVKKRLATSINDAKTIRRQVARTLAGREQEALQRKVALQLKIRQAGLAGQKLGRHKVPASDIDVQLGEDLSDSLRGLKVEGNLFRDRFQSLQQRALVEPRVRVLPKKRRLEEKEYEKHAWKNFV